MKNVFLLAFISMFCLACSDEVESNSPVIQGSVNNQFFRAPDATAFVNEDGSVLLTGVKGSRTITLQTASSEIGQYVLGGQAANQATFVDFSQDLYVAGAGSGDGMIEITEVNAGKLSGIFYFNAFSPGQDQALNFQKGVFFGVPITNASSDDDPSTTEDSMTAEIGGANFEADLVTVQNLMETTLVVTGQKQTTTIALSFPVDIEVGDHPFTNLGGPSVDYIVNGVSETVESGALTIDSNDTVEQIVTGTFEFVTVNGTEVANGTFTATY